MLKTLIFDFNLIYIYQNLFSTLKDLKTILSSNLKYQLFLNINDIELEETIEKQKIFDSIIKTNQPNKINLDNSVFITQNKEYAEQIVIQNPYTFVLLLNNINNNDLITEKRILRINNLFDIPYKLIYISHMLENRLKRKDLFLEKIFDIISLKEQQQSKEVKYKLTSNMKFHNEIKQILNKYDLTLDFIPLLLKNLNIFSDYDDTLIDLQNEVIKYVNTQLNSNIQKEDIKDFYFWRDTPKYIEIFTKFLNSQEIYNSIVIPTQKNIDFVNEIKQNIRNFYVLTATIGTGHLSKEKQIETLFKLDNSNIIKTHSKDKMDFTFSILIDDNPYHIENVLKNNPEIYCFKILQNWNKTHLLNNSHVFTINDITEIEDYLPFIVVSMFDLYHKKLISLN